MTIRIIDVLNARRSVERRRRRNLAKRETRILGVLRAVEFAKSVKHATRKGYVWFQEDGTGADEYGGAIPVLGNGIPDIPGLPVMVGPSPRDPYALAVLGEYDSTINEHWRYDGPLTSQQKHAKTHIVLPGNPDPTYGTDPAWVTPRMLLPLLVCPTQPTASMRCRILPGAYHYANTLKYSGLRDTADLSSYVPASGLARLLYILVNGADDTLVYLPTDPFPWLSASDPVPSNIWSVTFPEGHVLCGSPILHYGQTSIVEADFLYDVRALFGAITAAISLDLDDLLDVADATPTLGNLLRADGTDWHSVAPSVINANEFGSGGATSGYALLADGTGGGDWGAVSTGEYEPLFGVVKTAGGAGEFATIQEGLDWFKGKVIVGDADNPCRLDVAPGTYAENVDVNDLIMGTNGRLQLWGDDRPLAGLTYADSAPANRSGQSNGGSGTVGLGHSGNDLSISCGSVQPDFAAAGLVAGDRVLVGDNAGAITEEEIASVSGHTLTLTNTAPTVGSAGSWVCILPNRRVEVASGDALLVRASGLELWGIYLYTSDGDAFGLYAGEGVQIRVRGCALRGAWGAYLIDGASLVHISDYPLSFIGSDTGLQTSRNAWAKLEPGASVAGGANGLVAADRGTIGAPDVVLGGLTSRGVQATAASFVRADRAAAVGVHNGGSTACAYSAGQLSYIDATDSEAYCVANDIDYSPATSDAIDNVGSAVTHS